MIVFLQRSLQAIFGLINTLFIFLFLSEYTQGWYITFLSLSSLYFIFEMGLNFVLINTAAKYFINSEFNYSGLIIGKNSNYIINLLLKFLKIYCCLSLIFFILLITIGFYIFSSKPDVEQIKWFVPWLILISLISLNLILQPFLYVIESSKNFSSIYIVRIIQTVLSSILTFILLYLDYKLWATISLPLVALICNILFLLIFYRNLFFKSFEMLINLDEMESL